MENLEKLAEFQLKNEEQLKIVDGNLPIDDSFATTQVGGGYCTSGGQDCQDSIWILFSQNGLKTSYNKTLPFDKELTGNADIVTQDLRLIERFFYQIRKLLGYQI